ncbi:hypothetical protein [Leifsonia poae]|uniref:hypothetical protein n=1 Tax=Leifsonia poae TaxID=110933 RepID=UPI001CBAF624|nr:hypothetical protein [Leifsonia poae]
MNAATLHESDVDMARFLSDATHDAAACPWLFKPLTLPTDELDRRTYDHETERQRRFLRGQHHHQKENTQP